MSIKNVDNYKRHFVVFLGQLHTQEYEARIKQIVRLQLNEKKCQLNKMAKYTQTIRRQKLTNCWSIFDHFVGLALKGLI